MKENLSSLCGYIRHKHLGTTVRRQHGHGAIKAVEVKFRSSKEKKVKKIYPGVPHLFI